MPEMRSPKMSRSPETPDEFNYDPLKMYLYKKAIRTGMERESSIRVNIIGNFSQGKTSLTRRLIGQNCEGVISTNGIEIRRFKCRKMKGGRLKLAEDENKDFFDRIAAVARSVDTEKLSERVERTAFADTQNDQDVLAITEDHTFSYEPTQRQIANTPIASQEPSVRQTVNIPTTSQEPTDDRSVTSNVQEQVVNTTRIPSISSEDFKTFSSGVDQENDDVELSFDMWDFGGQYIFYATHTLFHSRKALYLLVVDLSSPLDKIVIDNEFPAESGEKNMAYFIKFWIESIHAFVGPGPPVILVGTHKDQIQGTEEAKQYLDQIRSIFEDTDMIDHIQPEDFAVDNHDCSDTDIQNLLQYLIQKGSELVQTVEIPARWIQLEKKLNENRHKNVITFQDVMKIDADNEYPLKEEEQVKLFLQYHHEKGTLFYFDEEPMSKHVVLDPGFLVDAFKCIITPERFRLNDISIRHLWCSMRDEAKLTDGLINKVWSHNNDGFMKHKMVLLGYLKKHYIISQVVEYDTTRETYKEQDWYIVPSLLKDKCPLEVMEDFLREKPRTMVRYFMHFEQTSIVQMLFHRLISAALGKWAVLKFGNKQMLFKNLAVFKLQESLAGIADLRYSGIELRVVSLCKTTIGSQVPDGFRRFIEAIVTHEFRKLKSQMGDNGKPFSQKYRCNHKIHDLHGSHQTSDICLLQEKNFVFCPDNYTHKEVSGSEAKAEWFQDESIAIVYPKKNLTEKHLSQLAQAAIGKGWQLLGTELGIKQVEINHIMEENSQVAMMIFQMLLKWKANSEENATLDVLVESIKKCPSVTVEWDELRNIKDEQSGILMSEHSVFSQTLQDLTVKENDNMFLECAVSKPDVQVIWLKDNEEICTEMRRRKCVEKNIHRLFVDHVTNTDAGVYKCVFEDTCTTCTVTVEERKTLTEFLQTLSDICIEDKYGSASFQCKINKVGVDVKWYHGSQVLSPSEKYQLVDEGPIHILKIHNVVDTDEGTYHIVADGQTSSAMLYIEDTEEREFILQYLAEKRKSEDSEGLLEQKRTRLHISEGKEKDQTFRCSKMRDIEQLWSAGIETRSLLLKECERICTFIKNKSDRILYVWPAYDTSEEEEVVFVVVATGDVKVDVGYRTYIRTVDHYNEEGKYVMHSRKSAENRLSASQSEKIRNVIDLYADTLMQNHRYISVITGGGVRSVGFATGNEEIIPEACVVVYVLIKGKIPLDEEKIPKTLDGIPVDIREGGFQTSVLTASDFHTNVRMGCQITSSVKPDVYGTIGGFIEHPEYGLCGITCAHVLMNEQYMHNLRQQNKSVENEIVYQPDNKHEKRRLGPIKEVAYKAGGSGVPGIDLAVFQIDSRPPECGNFPGTSNAET
ncbi:uncharacterized protein LOC123533163, partial [Mercenaria mercenaria]|uniref:uncharacterized protein LOC123533163 n=1 Tax=Mercenaria mercenaria TaxID=6596 RepID=UPI00234EEF49